MVKPPATKPAKKSGSATSEIITEPGTNDVLCGRGGSINSHKGNEYFREVVEKHRRVYLNARFKEEKRLIASSIVSDIRALDPPGRFLAKDTSTGYWSDIGDEKARDKTSQALRENAPALRGEVRKDKRKRKRNRKVAPSRVDQSSTRNPLGIVQSSEAPIMGVAAVRHASFPPPVPQQVRSQPQWLGRFNYYPQGGYQLTTGRGPLHAAQVGPTDSQHTPPRLDSPPPFHIDSCALQTLPRTNQTNIPDIERQNLGKTGPKSMSSDTHNQITEQKQNDTLERQRENSTSIPKGRSKSQHLPVPDDASQLARLSEDVVVTKVNSLRGNATTSNMDISPKEKSAMINVTGAAEPAGVKGAERSESLKRSVRFPEKDPPRVDKRLRGEHYPNASHHYHQTGCDLPSIKIQSPYSPRRVEARSPSRTSSQRCTGSQPMAQSSPSPQVLDACYEPGNMAVPYSPIKTSLAKQETGTPSDQSIGSQKECSGDQKGSFFHTMTQHLFDGWDPDALCGGGISKIFENDETTISAPECWWKNDQSGTKLTPSTQVVGANPGDQVGTPEGIKMEYDPTSPLAIMGSSSKNKRMHRRTPSWEESLKLMSPSSFRFQPTPTPEKTARWREIPLGTTVSKSGDKSKQEVLPFDESILQQEDHDTMYAVALQQMENAAASEAHDSALVAYNNRTARSSTHDRHSFVREQGIASSLQTPFERGGMAGYVPPTVGGNSVPQVDADHNLAVHLQMVEQAGADTSQEFEIISRDQGGVEDAQENRNARSAHQCKLPPK